MSRISSDNYFNCNKRFNSSSKRFERNNELLQEYNNIIKESLKLNVVEKVPPSETNNFNQVGNILYLPHRQIIKDDRVTSKVRIVFDGSSKIEGPSWKDCLYPGYSLTEPLLSVILRFRANKIAFIADIEKAFFQISLKPEHGDFVQFRGTKMKMELLLKIFKNPKYDYRICRLLFGMTPPPFLLTSIIKNIKKLITTRT